MGKEVFCSKYGKKVIPKEIRVLTLTGEGLLEVRCSLCNELIYSERISGEALGLPRRMPRKLRAVYIAFEGIDGSGKTYHSQRVVKKLRELGIDVTYVKEPHIGAVKEFLHRSAEDIDPDAEAYIFAADRIILQKTVVLSSLERVESS